MMTGIVYDRACVVPRALRITLGSGWSLAGTGAVFIIFAIVYAMVLPATYTGGVVGLVSLRFLTPGTLVLALVMALLLALTIALAVHGFRNGAGAKSAGGALGAILGILPSLLCCSPILPLGIAAIAAFLPAAGSLGAPIQGFIATHEFWIYGVAIVLMVWGLYGNARRILSCTYRCSSAPTRTQREVNHACCEPSANRASGQEPRRSE